MTDIVERLRKKPIRQNYESRGTVNDRSQMERNEAADEIERLREEIVLLHDIVANVRKSVRDGLYKYEMKKDTLWHKEGK